jgi:hypothetical protein
MLGGAGLTAAADSSGTPANAAAVTGKTATAVRIIDWTLLKHSHMQFGPGSGAHG